MATSKMKGPSKKKKLSGKAPLTNARNRPLRNATEDSLKKYFKEEFNLQIKRYVIMNEIVIWKLSFNFPLI